MVEIIEAVPDKNKKIKRDLLRRMDTRLHRAVETSNPDADTFAEVALEVRLAQANTWFESELAIDQIERAMDAVKDLTGEGIQERIKDANA